MSAVETGQMSAAETGQMSAVETKDKWVIEAGLCPAPTLNMCLVFQHQTAALWRKSEGP